MAETEQDRTIKTTVTVFDIIEILQQNREMRLSEIAEEVEKAPSTVHDHLTTLENSEYIVRVGDSYRLGLKFLLHGQTAKNSISVIDEISPVLEYVAEETKETVWFLVEEHGKGVYVDRALGERAVKTHFSIGARRPLHTLASGKAILSQLPRDRVEEIIDMHGLSMQTENSITDREELLEELDTIREEGIAFNKGESLSGMHAVASPILRDEVVCGSICVAGPANRIRGGRFQQEIPDIVSGATNEIELKLSYS